MSKANIDKIKELSLAELKELQARVEKEIPTKAKEAAREAATEVRRILNAFEISWETLKRELEKRPGATAKKVTKKKASKKKRSTKKAGTKVAPKYRHPDNPKLTWAGRGRKPKWLEAELAKGKKQEDFAIKS